MQHESEQRDDGTAGFVPGSPVSSLSSRSRSGSNASQDSDRSGDSHGSLTSRSSTLSIRSRDHIRRHKHVPADELDEIEEHVDRAAELLKQKLPEYLQLVEKRGFRAYMRGKKTELGAVKGPLEQEMKSLARGALLILICLAAVTAVYDVYADGMDEDVSLSLLVVLVLAWVGYGLGMVWVCKDLGNRLAEAELEPHLLDEVYMHSEKYAYSVAVERVARTYYPLLPVAQVTLLAKQSPEVVEQIEAELEAIGKDPARRDGCWHEGLRTVAHTHHLDDDEVELVISDHIERKSQASQEALGAMRPRWCRLFDQFNMKEDGVGQARDDSMLYVRANVFDDAMDRRSEGGSPRGSFSEYHPT